MRVLLVQAHRREGYTEGGYNKDDTGDEMTDTRIAGVLLLLGTVVLFIIFCVLVTYLDWEEGVYEKDGPVTK